MTEQQNEDRLIEESILRREKANATARRAMVALVAATCGRHWRRPEAGHK
jgi:hypothetical protein